MTKSKLLGSLAWLLAIVVMAWCVAIVYWQANDVQPTARDLTLYLGVLPVGVFLTLVLLKKGMTSAADKAKQTGTQPASGASGPKADSRQSEPAAPVAIPPLAILAGGLCLPAGASADEVIQALAEPRQVGLHKRLKDGAGFPIFAGWVEDLDTGAMEQALDEAVAGHRQRAQRLTEEQLRALALLRPVVQDLLLLVSSEGLLAKPEAQQDVRQRAPLPAPELKINLSLSLGWAGEAQRDAREWLLAEAVASGLPADRTTVETSLVTSNAELWQQFAAIAGQPVTSSAPVYHLVMACDSAIGPHGVERLERAGQMRSARQPEGLVPGEGAAGVLLVAGDERGAFPHKPQAIARGMVLSQQGITWQTRSAVRQMSEMLTQTLAFSQLGKEDLLALVSDADQRKSRSAAVSGVVAIDLPHLEPESQCHSIGGACGHLGHVASLAVLALAAAKAQQDDAPVLALLVSEASERAMVTLSAPMKPKPEAETGSVV